MKVNKEWHEKNKLGEKASLDKRVEWHLEHEKNCACAPIPKDVIQELEKRGTRVKTRS